MVRAPILLRLWHYINHLLTYFLNCEVLIIQPWLCNEWTSCKTLWGFSRLHPILWSPAPTPSQCSV